jgi:hypothetical protein
MMFMKRDRLSRWQRLGESKKVLGVAELAVNLDHERQSPQWTCSVHEAITVVLLQDKRNGRFGRLFSGIGLSGVSAFPSTQDHNRREIRDS